MSTAPSEFLMLMQRLRDGSDEAARELLDRYGHHVVRAVRRRLKRTLRSRFDSQDFTQAVWASFFESRQKNLEFERPEGLIAFLVSMACNKVTDGCRRYYESEKNDMEREQSLDHMPNLDGEEFTAKGPTPSETAVGNEAWDRLRTGQPSQYQRMLQMRGHGATLAEVASKLGVDEETVRRVLKRIERDYEA